MKSFIPKSGSFALVCFLLLGTVVIAAELPAPEVEVLKNRLVPTPKNIQFTDGPEVILDKSTTVVVELAKEDASAKANTAALFRRCFGAEPAVSIAVKDTIKEPDVYRVKAAGKTVTISAADFAGVRHAFSTLRQLAESNRGTLKTVDFRIPETEIDDAPAMAFRGLHVTWFPEITQFRIEQAIRLAAYYKFNHVVIEFRGNFMFALHPELCWKEFHTTPQEVKKLVALGKELGVTLIPFIPMFGHASGSREVTGKHTTLDLFPEYLPLFEPDGWVWCLSNPAVRKVLTEAVLEMYEVFDNPPYFHIGCDEAYEPAQCRSCRRADYKKLFMEHLLYFQKLLAERNCRIMMWHDMLIQKSNPRWKGYTAVGNPKTEGLLEQLPKDIVICDWQYGTPKENEQWPTMRFFKEQGFMVLACPWNKASGTFSLGKTVAEAKLDGMLCTLWHRMHGGDLMRMTTAGAQATWLADNAPVFTDRQQRFIFHRHLRQVSWDMPVKKYRDTGAADWQVSPENFMGDTLPSH